MFETTQAAIEYIRAHDDAVKDWDRKSKTTLAGLVRARAAGSRWVMGGPGEWSKDELINWLADSHYPQISEAREVAYQDALAVEERWTHSSRGEDES